MSRVVYACLILLVPSTMLLSQESKLPLGPYQKYIDRLNNSSDLSGEQLPESALTLVGRWAWGPCNAVATFGDYALIGNGPTLQILDMANPTSPVIVSEYLSSGGLFDIGGSLRKQHYRNMN